MTISVVIIAKNEATSIAECLASVAWADERIVLDSGSTDGTVDMARELGAAVYVTPDWPGFGPQKNRAIALATCDWILSLDADEQVSPQLRDEILSVVKTGDAVAYRMPRSSRYCGRYLCHGGWWPDHVTRLFRHGHGRFSDDLVHERLLVEGKVGTLTHPLLHDTYASLEEVIGKINRYSSLGAEQAFARGERCGLMAAIGHGAWAFFRTYVLRLGFLDGGHGFLLAVSNAEATYYRYAKLWLKGR
jgi:glycosyltransferase involved in cell wall biosynthesis